MCNYYSTPPRWVSGIVISHDILYKRESLGWTRPAILVCPSFFPLFSFLSNFALPHIVHCAHTLIYLSLSLSLLLYILCDVRLGQGLPRDIVEGKKGDSLLQIWRLNGTRAKIESDRAHSRCFGGVRSVTEYDLTYRERLLLCVTDRSLIIPTALVQSGARKCRLYRF